MKASLQRRTAEMLRRSHRPRSIRAVRRYRNRRAENRLPQVVRRDSRGSPHGSLRTPSASVEDSGIVRPIYGPFSIDTNVPYMGRLSPKGCNEANYTAKSEIQLGPQPHRVRAVHWGHRSRGDQGADQWRRIRKSPLIPGDSRHARLLLRIGDRCPRKGVFRMVGTDRTRLLDRRYFHCLSQTKRRRRSTTAAAVNTGWRKGGTLTRSLAAVALAAAMTGCNPLGFLFPKSPEAQLKGMWLLAEISKSYLWYRSLSFTVYYFDGQGNVSVECQKLWSQGWDTNELDCFKTSGGYSVKDDVLTIDTSVVSGRYRFRRVGDVLWVGELSDKEPTTRFVMIRDYPWVIYRDTCRFIRSNGTVDESFFKGYLQ